MVRRSRLRGADAWALAVDGLGGRPVRTVLSASGIALGVATVVAVLGISTSSRAQLIAEIDALGTNLLTVTPGQAFSGSPATLPKTAPAMIDRIGPVRSTSAVEDVAAGVHVFRNDRISAANTNGISVYGTQDTLLGTLQGHCAAGRFLDAATEHFPAVVLGAQAARALGVERADGSVQVWLGRHLFSVVGILRPLALAPELDLSALVGYPIAARLLGADGSPAQVYVRTDPATTDAVSAVLAATADPAAPQDVSVANPADALVARADASAAFESLFLALGVVALVIGGVGIANVMTISVLERRGEIGLRRALGARRVHIGAQFVTESALLAGVGGLAGAAAGAFATAAYATTRHWDTTVPLADLGAAIVAALVVGVAAGLYPALRAARLSPLEALRAV
ncbi:MAG TPA: ABC transporter permease [Candidatus Sulfotelmatobacter sp.]|nr:ABC transporter permease [Candidatus Sulfotelmatobacter sp.]